MEEGAKEFDNLLKRDFGYVSPSDQCFGKNVFVNIKTGDKLLKILGVALTRWQKRGETLGRLVLYYHGHGIQVEGHPCLLTTTGEAVPMEELINKVVNLTAADRYYIINDCCANKEAFDDEALKERVREAHAVVKDANIVKMKAVPEGKEADAEEGKTLTFALVSILEWEGRGVRLSKLEKRLRKEQRKQGSLNVPIIEVSDELAKETFPL